MQKNLFKISNLKLKKVYGLPTVNGLVLAGLLGAALWFAIINISNTERWIFILMLFLFLFNLMDTSHPFRMIEIRVLPMDPPFSSEPTNINIQIDNPSEVKSGPLWIRMIGEDQWIEHSAVEAHASQIVRLSVTFPNSGPQHLPVIRIKTYADSGLYRFWRNFDFQREIIVLPKPVDHQVPVSLQQSVFDDNDLVGFDEIHDPSRFTYADPKLLQKTGRHYQRIFQTQRVSAQVSFRWADLEGLTRQHKGEQFSFWLKSLAVMQRRQSLDIKIEAPFVGRPLKVGVMDLARIKSNFAQWFYAQV